MWFPLVFLTGRNHWHLKRCTKHHRKSFADFSVNKPCMLYTPHTWHTDVLHANCLNYIEIPQENSNFYSNLRHFETFLEEFTHFPCRLRWTHLYIPASSWCASTTYFGWLLLANCIMSNAQCCIMAAPSPCLIASRLTRWFKPSHVRALEYSSTRSTWLESPPFLLHCGEQNHSSEIKRNWSTMWLIIAPKRTAKHTERMCKVSW